MSVYSMRMFNFHFKQPFFQVSLQKLLYRVLIYSPFATDLKNQSFNLFKLKSLVQLNFLPFRINPRKMFHYFKLLYTHRSISQSNMQLLKAKIFTNSVKIRWKKLWILFLPRDIYIYIYIYALLTQYGQLTSSHLHFDLFRAVCSFR